MRDCGMALALALGVAPIGSPRPAAQGAELAGVKVGSLGLISDAGLCVAMEKGYFHERGIRNEIEVFASAAKRRKCDRDGLDPLRWAAREACALQC